MDKHTTAQRLFDTLAGHGNRIFLIQGDQTTTYAELTEETKEIESRLRSAGVCSHATVLLRGDFNHTAVAALLALRELRAVVAPCAMNLPHPEWKRRAAALTFDWSITASNNSIEITRISSAGATTEPVLQTMLSRLVAINHAGLILFSSGTSGTPKIVLHDLDALFGKSLNQRRTALRIMLFLVFDHIGGLNTLLSGVCSGATLVAPASRNPDEVVDLVERHRVNILPTTPSFLSLLLMRDNWQRRDLSALKLITYGTEPMPEKLLKRLRTALPKTRFTQAFGTTETGIAQTVTKSSDSTLFRFDGKTEMRIVDGELWLRGPTQALGYITNDGGNLSNPFSNDGWFRTGDQAHQTPDGYIRLTGRCNELINVGGQKVHPAEVEAVLMEMDAIADCVVRPQTHPIIGQVVSATVVPKNLEQFSQSELRSAIRSHCRRHLDRYQVPVYITIVDALPVSSRSKRIRMQAER